MKRLSDLLDKDIKIVEKRKIIFSIPVCFIALAIILAVIFNFVLDSALNLGMDFAGGYTINVNVGANMTEENSNDYKSRVRQIVENYSDADDKPYGIKVSQILVTGTGDDTALQVKFKSIADDDTMEEIVEGIRNELEQEVTVITPAVKKDGNKVTVTYNLPVGPILDILRGKVGSLNGESFEAVGETDPHSIAFTYAGALDESGIADALKIEDKFSANVYTNGKVGATVSKDLLYNAISAILIALVLMLAYIAIRFELKSGVAAIVALIHDLIVMFAFMIIFHIEFNSTFIAALITILGYSINNAIILFDRVRSNLKMYPDWNANTIANKSISQSFVRCMNTTITTVIMIGCVALVCAIASIFNPDLYQMVTFSLPIIVGLLSGLYSSMFVAPSVWVSLNHGKKGKKVAIPAEAKE